MVPGLFNQPCQTDPRGGSYCDGKEQEETVEEMWKTREEDEEAGVKADILSSSGVQNIWQKGDSTVKLEAKCIHGVDQPAVGGSRTVCKYGPAGCEKNENYYGTWRCEVCKCVKRVPKPAPLCKFRYTCFKDMHKFDKSRYMNPNGDICALSVVEPDTDSPGVNKYGNFVWPSIDGAPPCQRLDPSYEVRRYLETQKAKDLQMACKKEHKCPAGCLVTISA